MFRKSTNNQTPLLNSNLQMWYLGVQDWFSPRPKYNSTTTMSIQLPPTAGGTTLDTKSTIKSVNL